MLDKVITHYLNKLSAKNLVFSKMKVMSRLFWIVLVISVLSATILLFTKPIYLIVVLAGIIMYLHYFNKKAKQVIHHEYGIKPSKGGWAGDDYQDYVQAQLNDFLDSKQINNSMLVEKLIARLSKRIEETKIVVYFVPGVFFGFMIPSWAAYNSIILFKEKSYEEATILIVTIFICLVAVAFLLGMIKYMSSDIISTKRQKLIQLLDFLHDIQLEFILKEEASKVGVNNVVDTLQTIRKKEAVEQQRFKSKRSR